MSQLTQPLQKPKPNRPIIISGRKEVTLIPQDDPNFNQSVETAVSFTQACNWFVSFILIYETIKQVYYVFYYDTKCEAYSKVMIYYMLANSFWIVISFIGAGLIRSKEPKKILIFFILLIIAFLSRIGIYFIMYGYMTSAITTGETTTEEDEKKACFCKSIYIDTLYLIQAIIEALVLLVMIVCVKIIHKYIVAWEAVKTEYLFGKSNISSTSGPGSRIRANKRVL